MRNAKKTNEKVGFKGTTKSVFLDLKNSRKRYNLICGGRNSGKTIDIILYCISEMMTTNRHILATRYTMTSNETSLYSTFKKYIESNEKLANYFIIQTDKIICKISKSEIVFKGIKTSSKTQTANLKGLERFSIFLIDEAEEWTDEESFEKLDYSIRDSRIDCKILIILNPCYKTHWIYKKFIEPNYELIDIEGFMIEKSKIKKVNHIISTYHRISKHLPKDILEKIEEEKQFPNRYREIILGGWSDSPEGLMYEDGIIEKDITINPLDHIVYSFTDVAEGGGDYWCTIYCVIIDNKFYIFDVIYTKNGLNSTLPELVSKCERYKSIKNFLETNRSGAALINQLYTQYGLAFTGFYSKTNKLQRIFSQCHRMKLDFIFALNGGKDFMLFKSHLKSFPKTGFKQGNGNDDAPDTVSFMQEFRFKNQQLFN